VPERLAGRAISPDGERHIVRHKACDVSIWTAVISQDFLVVPASSMSSKSISLFDAAPPKKTDPDMTSLQKTLFPPTQVCTGQLP